MFFLLGSTYDHDLRLKLQPLLDFADKFRKRHSEIQVILDTAALLCHIYRIVLNLLNSLYILAFYCEIQLNLKSFHINSKALILLPSSFDYTTSIHEPNCSITFLKDFSVNFNQSYSSCISKAWLKYVLLSLS